MAHIPVLLDEVLVALNPRPGGIYLDCTVGAGGHAEEILKETAPDGRVIGLDRDASAVDAARFRLGKYGERATVLRSDYADFQQKLDQLGIATVDGMLLDLGVSSTQLDDPERGFSFRWDSPLDMRYDMEQDLTADAVDNEYGRSELRRIFRDYGEEHMASAVADAIMDSRRKKRIETTTELVTLIEKVISARGQRIHPATRTFQALRMEVNRELESLRRFLSDFIDRLKAGGRIVTISFHSLEDRLVKDRFRELAKGCVCPPDMPICGCGRKPRLKLINQKVIRPTEFEVQNNPRSRSAKLRAAAALAKEV